MSKKLVFEKIKEGSTDVFVFEAKKDSKGPGSIDRDASRRSADLRVPRDRGASPTPRVAPHD